MLPTRKPDIEATKLFGAKSGVAVHVITGQENRLMICDACTEAANIGQAVKTNHALNESLEWVCVVCGYNPARAMMDDDNTMALIGATARLLGQMDEQRRLKWAIVLMECISVACGKKLLREMSNWIGRELFNG